MKITRMNKGNDWGKTKAYFDLEIDGFTIKNFKIIDSVNGLFAAFPSEKKDGEYKETVWAERALKDKVNVLALAAYGQDSPIITAEDPIEAVAVEGPEFSDEDIPF